MTGTPSEMLSSMQQGVTAINALATIFNTLSVAMQSYGGTSVTALNSIASSSSTQAVAADAVRVSLMFHNPSSSVSLLLAPAKDTTGAALTPSFSSRGGSLLLLPQNYLQVGGDVCQQAWNVIASGGSGNPLTVMAI